MKRVLAASLCAALVLVSPGLAPYALWAQVVEVPVPLDPAVGAALPILPAAVPPAAAGLSSLQTLPALSSRDGLGSFSNAARPLVWRPAGASVARAVRRAVHSRPAALGLLQTPGLPARPVLGALLRPSLATPEAVRNAGSESLRELGLRDFLRLGGSAPYAELGGVGSLGFGAVGKSRAEAKERGRALARGSSVSTRRGETARVEEPLERAPRGAERRSVLFPFALAAISGGAYAAAMGARAWLGHGEALGEAARGFPWSGLGLGALGCAALAFAALAAAELGLYAAMLWRGRGATPEAFWGLVRSEAAGGRIDPSLIGPVPGQGVIRLYTPRRPVLDFTYGFAHAGSVYLRPELASTPWLLRLVLGHELRHLQAFHGRGPPPSGVLARLGSELRIRLSEWVSFRTSRVAGLSVLQRALQASRFSLRLPHPFDVLAIDPPSEEGLREDLDQLSQGRSRLHVLRLAGAKLDLWSQLESLGAGSFKAVLLSAPSRFLPAAGSLEQRKIDLALRQLGSLRADLERRVQRRPKARGRYQRQLDLAWQALYSGRLKGIAAVEAVDRLYHSLGPGGIGLVQFEPGEPGVPLFEELLLHYASGEEGRFSVVRVDLAEGGQVLVVQKRENRVGLWIQPRADFSFRESLTNIAGDPDKSARAGELLRQAGLEALFRKLEAQLRRESSSFLEIRHIFGAADAPPSFGNRVYFTVPKSVAKAVKKLMDAEPNVQVELSEAGFKPQLSVSGPLMRVPWARAQGFKGQGIKIFWIDTGLDVSHPFFANGSNGASRMDLVDLVNEGPEDYVGHGTHVAGISAGDGIGGLIGMAPEAQGKMGKVFSRDGLGASDGDIMAAGLEALKWGALVINLSLGSPGGPHSKLSKYFSELTLKKNTAGLSPTVFVAAGNAGPARQSIGQPAAGARALSVAASTKGETDGLPNSAFYTSVGPSWDKELGKYRQAPKGAAIGGNVASPLSLDPEDQAKEDIYKHGVRSAKSRSMSPEPGDSPDRLSTTMSGTSQASPMAAGIGALVIEALLRAAAEKPELKEKLLSDLPFVVGAVMNRSAQDLQEPYQRQGAGLYDAEAALRLVAESSGIPSWAGGLVRGLKRFLGPPPVSLDPESAWDWLDDYRAVLDAGDAPYLAAQAAREQFLAQSKSRKDGRSDPAALQEAGRLRAAVLEEGKQKSLPILLKGLKHRVWLIRFASAFELLNFKSADAALALLDRALHDEDARVRKLAFEALAETPTRKADPMLVSALRHKSWDVELYAAYALARHGDSQGIARLAALALDRRDPAAKRIRVSAAALAGEIPKLATPELAEALASRVADAGETDTVRHVALASLGEFLKPKEAALTAEALRSVLQAAAPDQLILTQDISDFFALAAGRSALVKRMRSEPLKEDILKFIAAYRPWVGRPGPLGSLVQALARAVGVKLDIPTPPSDPEGRGIPGVDGRLGPVQLYVQVPPGRAVIRRFAFFRDGGSQAAQALEGEAAGAGLGREVLERYEARLRAALPGMNGITLEVPESKSSALMLELEGRGFAVHPARPVYAKLKDTGPLSGMPDLRVKGLAGKGVTIAVLDEGGDVHHPAFKGRVRAVKNFTSEGSVDDVSREAIGHGTHVAGIAAGQAVEGSPYIGMAPEARLAFAKVLGSRGGTDVQVMEGQAWAASLSQNPLVDPVVLNESLGGPGEEDSIFNRSVNQAVLGHLPFVAAAGNEGPAEGTIGNPGNAALAHTVAAAGKDGRLTDYSSRGTPDKPFLAHRDFGGRAYFDRPDPYEITAPLSTELAPKVQASPRTVWWPDRESGRPLYQDMSGTSMAAPHTAGKLAVLVGLMLEKMGELPAGYPLWLREFVKSAVTKSPEYAPEESGAGFFDNVGAVAGELSGRLSTAEGLQKIREQSQALWDQAMREHGDTASGSRGSGKGSDSGSLDRAIRLAGWPADAPESLRLVPGDGSQPDPDLPPAPTLGELRDVLGGGGPSREDGARLAPFRFHALAGPWVEARNAGLEGFLFSKAEVELNFGKEALKSQWSDFFPYLQSLLGAYAWGRPVLRRLARLRDSFAPYGQKNEELNRLLSQIVGQLQGRLERLDEARWMRTSRTYEIFARAFNLPGFQALRLGQPPPRGEPPKGRFFRDFGDEDLLAIKAQGFNTLWILGLFPMDDWGSGGGSPYSISSTRHVNFDLGTDEEFSGFVQRAHRLGLKVMIDFVPNHTAWNAELVGEHPEWFIHQEVPEGADPRRPPLNYFAAQDKNGRWSWVHHGGYLEGDVTPVYWDKTAQLDYSNAELQDYMAGLVRSFIQRFDVDAFRVDMAYRILNRNFSASWGTRMPRGEFLARMIREAKALKPSVGFSAEAYDNWDELSAAGFDLIYNKNDHDMSRGEAGWYDRLRSRAPDGIREAVRRLAFLFWQRGSSSGQQFGGNHDEWSPQRAFGPWWRAAMFLTLLLPGALLFYASNEIGFDRPEPRDPSENAKTLPFSAKVWVDWQSFDPDIRAFFEKTFLKQRELAARLGQAVLSPLDLHGSGAVGYALLPGRDAPKDADQAYVVLANPTEREIAVSVERPDLGLAWRGSLPPYGYGALQFKPAASAREDRGLWGLLGQALFMALSGLGCLPPPGKGPSS